MGLAQCDTSWAAAGSLTSEGGLVVEGEDWVPSMEIRAQCLVPAST